MTMTARVAARRPAIALALVLVAAAAYAATPTLQQDPFGSNRTLYDALKANAHFRSLPKIRHTICSVGTEMDTLALYEHGELAPGVVGTAVADYTKFADGELTGEPWLQSGAFGGMILLRGTSAPSTAITVTGDPMFPLKSGNVTQFELTRSQSRLIYECTTSVAPPQFDIGLSGTTYLLSCKRTTRRNSGETQIETPNYALCNDSIGLCPLHWTGENGHEALFDHYTVNGERFSPVEWNCAVDGPTNAAATGG